MAHSNDDKATAQAVMRIIALLDGLVFPNEPLPKHTFVDDPPQPTNFYLMGFGPYSTATWSYAAFLPGAHAYVQSGLKQVHLALSPLDTWYAMGQFPQYSFDDAKFEIAAHEVRHRLQLGRGIAMIGPEHAQLIERLRLLVKILGMRYQLPGAGKEAEAEFDSSFVACLATYAARQKASVPVMMRILTVTPETLPLILDEF